MRRLSGSGYVDVISQAFEILPPRIYERVKDVDFLCGVNPWYIGWYREEYPELSESVASFWWPSYERPTISIPTLKGATFWTVLHELGHALHATLDYHDSYNFTPLTKYAKTNFRECFADSFALWFYDDMRGLPQLRGRDPVAEEFFRQLCR